MGLSFLSEIMEKQQEKDILEMVNMVLADFIGRDPKNIMGMSLLANSYRLEKKYSVSLELYNKVLHLEPSDDKTLNNIGIVLNSVKLDEAYNVYEALKINPKNFEANNNMGVILSAQKKYKKSIDAFRTAIKLNCSFAGSYYGLGMAYFEMGKYEKQLSLSKIP